MKNLTDSLLVNQAELPSTVIDGLDRLCSRSVPQRNATIPTTTRLLTLIPLLALFFLTGCQFALLKSSNSMDSPVDSAAPTDFIVKGITGEDVLLDRLWDRGCVSGTNGNDWTDAKRTLTGLELVFTLIDYQNGSATPDCTNGRVGFATFTTLLTYDNTMVPIIWVDENGDEAAAPAGLEAVTEANGATAFFTETLVTPEAQVRADQLNAFEFCGFTDWAPNETKDVGTCFTGGFNPVKGTVIVDDRTMPWKIYDGIGNVFDENGYPIDMPNYLPHEGPFAP